MNLNCVCGYVHEDKFCRDSDYVGGEDEFILIQGQFVIKDESSYRCPPEREVYLYACPKCNTIQMSKY